MALRSIQALREERNQISKELRNLNEQNAGALWAKNPENQKKYDEGMLKIDEIDAELASHERANNKLLDDNVTDAMREAAKRSGADPAAVDTKALKLGIFNKWLRSGDNALTAEDWQQIRNTMSEGTNSQGGYTVPTEVISAIRDALKLYGGVRQSGATMLTGVTGNPVNFPNSNGTSEVGELIGENTTATALDPSFGVSTLTAYKFSSKIVAIPFELLQDSNADMESFIIQRLATRLGRILNTKFTVGSGTGEPQGLVTAAASGVVGTTGQTTTVIFNNLVDLIHSVDPAYRTDPSCKFMMADSSLKVIRKLQDSQNRPIFLPGYIGLADAMPNSILGYDVIINQDVAAMAASAKSILFGAYSYYVIRDVMQMEMFRFMDSAYAKLGQIGFLAWMRSGGVFTDVGNSLFYYQNSAS